jgi:hypothetical protein
MPYLNRCPVCHRQFESTRSDAITCSFACRKKKSRQCYKHRYITFEQIRFMAFEWAKEHSGRIGGQLTDYERLEIVVQFLLEHPYYISKIV